MELQTISFSQNGKTLFCFVLSAKVIYDRFEVSRRIEDKEKGYQRSFSSSRIKQITRYIDKENGILPNSILVNLDEGKYSYDENMQILTLNNEEALGLIIDGQHRVWGAHEAKEDIMLQLSQLLDWM